MQPDIEFFRQLLKSTLGVSWLEFGLLFLFIALLKFIDIVCSKKRACNGKSKKSNTKKSLETYEILSIGLLTLAAVLTIHGTVNILADLHDDSFICIHGEYYVRGGELHGKNSSVHIYTEDGLIQLDRPKTLEGFGQYERENFPVGRCYGTVWYAEHSKIILSFIPDDR